MWDETLNNVGGWTSDGCRITNLLNNLIVFQCDRLGYYGLLQEISHLGGNKYGISIHNRILFKKEYSLPRSSFYHLTFAVCMEQNSDTHIRRYTLGAS